MAVTVSPGALPAPKKNTNYQLTLTASGGTAPYSWAVTSGALPAFLTLKQINPTQALVSGKVPGSLNSSTFTATITATDSLAATGTCVSTGVTTSVDGPDPEGFHGATESVRTQVATADQVFQGSGLTVGDAIARQWPLSGPSQNS